MPSSPMAKSTLVTQMDAIQLSLDGLLRARGFRKHGRTYNRSSEVGVIQVVNLQMGPFDPPATTYVPGLTKNMYGLFTVNLGVFVAEVYRDLQHAVHAMPYVREYSCCIRARLGEDLGRGKELWWKIAAEAATDVGTLLESVGFPFLDRLGSRDEILRELAATGWSPLGNASDPGRIVAAIILAERGERERARRLLLEQFRAPSPNPGHPTYVQALATQLGLDPIGGV